MKKFRFADVLAYHEICNSKEITEREYKQLSDSEKECIAMFCEDSDSPSEYRKISVDNLTNTKILTAIFNTLNTIKNILMFFFICSVIGLSIYVISLMISFTQI